MDEATIASVFPGGEEQINRYVDILASRGIDWGLIGPRERDRLWERHVLNSVALGSRIPSGATVVDVGSGAGLPGIPLAIQRPDLSVTLLEPLLRRANFLNLAVDELELADRVQVVRGRAEEHRSRYDIVTCRAVAPLPRLLGWCLPLVAPGGRLIALKGSSAAAEVLSAKDDLRRLRAKASVLELPIRGLPDESTWAIEVSR
ncbi:MAG: 16S rRNA (guanine(527)-N(7))-methyltransferase RsmG [Actinobacteria bacterium]|nr:16S rRNA (guanine(527)-N(7))-methyltransferase RsmG [Actinomycetota bacterium]